MSVSQLKLHNYVSAISQARTYSTAGAIVGVDNITASLYVADGAVHLHLSALVATPPANATLTITGIIPAAYRPAVAQNIPIIVEDNGAVVYGSAQIATNGNVVIGVGAAGAAFSAAGGEGGLVDPVSISYVLP